MSFDASRRLWIVISAVLLSGIIAGALVIQAKFPRSPAIEISLPSSQEYFTEVVVSGAVNNPGIYNMKNGDTIAGVLNAAGGITADADKANIVLSVPRQGGDEGPQKVDINRAESWLLEALPGIGETLGRRIIEYRERNGPFHNINEITRVDGMTLGTYEKIRNYITVTD